VTIPDRLLGYVQADFFFQIESEPTPEPIHLRKLHESLAPYIDVVSLRRLVAHQEDIYAALRDPDPPAEIQALLDTLATLLRPRPREPIRSPHDVAAVLMIEMGQLDQEQLRTVLLDTKNRVQNIVTVYRGCINKLLHFAAIGRICVDECSGVGFMHWLAKRYTFSQG
jgi:hypothetical protein